MGKKCESGEASEYEGIVRVRWCELCFGWHCKRSWERSSEHSSVAFWLGSGEHLWIPADDFSDRNLNKFITGTAQTCRILEASHAGGQEMLDLGA